MSDDNEKKRYEKVTTPRVTLVWPKLHEADFGSKQFPDPEGSFKTKFNMPLDAEPTERFLALLRPIHDEAVELGRAEFAKLKAETRKKLKDITVNDLYTELLDKETEEPTGDIQFSAKMKATFTYRKGPKAGQKGKRVCPIFDSFGQRIEKPPVIFGGTIARVTVVPSIYFIPGTGACGVSLNLEAAQIIKLSSAERNADSYGFGKEEDGYQH